MAAPTKNDAMSSKDPCIKKDGKYQEYKTGLLDQQRLYDPLEWP